MRLAFGIRIAASPCCAGERLRPSSDIRIRGVNRPVNLSIDPMETVGHGNWAPQSCRPGSSGRPPASAKRWLGSELSAGRRRSLKTSERAVTKRSRRLSAPGCGQPPSVMCAQASGSDGDMPRRGRARRLAASAQCAPAIRNAAAHPPTSARTPLPRPTSHLRPGAAAGSVVRTPRPASRAPAPSPR